MTHDLKCCPRYFRPVADERKKFEIRERRNRNFQVGDILLLREWSQKKKRYTGKECARRVTYITDFEQKPGFVVMSLARL